MKKFLLIFVLFFFQNNAFSKNIVYLDIQYIIDNSDLGIFYKSKINKLDITPDILKILNDETKKNNYLNNEE